MLQVPAPQVEATLLEADEPPVTLAAYNHLCQRVDKAAEIARTQMMFHVTVTGYGLVTLLTVRDIDFFARTREKSGLKLPLVDIEMPWGWYMLAIALLSSLTMVHFRICYRRAVQLGREADALGKLFRDDPGFVPAGGRHRYPWFAFALGEPGGWSKVASPLFSMVQWLITPLLWVLCCARTIRLGTTFQHWVSYQIPWHWPFTIGAVVSAVLCARARAGDARADGGSARRSLNDAVQWVVLGAMWVGVSASGGPFEAFNLKLRHARLEGMVLPEIGFEGAELWDAHMEGANLRMAHMEGARFRGAHMEGARLWDAHMEGANLRGAHLEVTDLQMVHMEGADLRRAHLEGADLWRAHLEGARFRGAHMEGARLWDAHLEGVDLRRAHLEGADLWRAHVEGARLWDAHLEGADLRRAHMEGANLENAAVLQMALDGGIVPPWVPPFFFTDEAASERNGRLPQPACGDDLTSLPPLLVITPCDPGPYRNAPNAYREERDYFSPW